MSLFVFWKNCSIKNPTYIHSLFISGERSIQIQELKTMKTNFLIQLLTKSDGVQLKRFLPKFEPFWLFYMSDFYIFCFVRLSLAWSWRDSIGKRRNAMYICAPIKHLNQNVTTVGGLLRLPDICRSNRIEAYQQRPDEADFNLNHE